ncbi:S66 peptidase family protein [Paenibacillus aceris]|uniref:Muramoyltetrapeptide carboxypeptidase n=1 Tax=Paenibacillus aceris TaxID=869555 RepID=A0ABS4I748_9BACL|nr:LD-carboxypeptidase [Paenibacillus aceris]MBP1966734.1 muramoyltetrapeptide carboxypeptidase [Paenibacillus aceris]NHW34996.1 LD-carboxypeptidase [Paenibacillus aceris]
MVELIKPRRLSPGDTVGITAPASLVDTEQVKEASTILEKMGLHVRLGDTLTMQHGYLAGTDEARAAEMNAMFADPAIKAIICARGGYGTGRIANLLDYDLIRANPKIFWGYSDITFLHAAIGRFAGLVTFHGPMLIDLGKEDLHPLTVQNYETLLHPSVLRYTEEISPLQTLVEGEAFGPIIGGNLSLIVSTLGTPYELDTRGKLLLIEDIDEEPYRLDRMLNQLRHAGKFADAAGILICDFHNCVPNKRKVSFTLEEIFSEHIVSAGKPTLSGFKIGHCSPNIAVPLGIGARMSTYEKLLACTEPGVEA